MTTPIDSLLVVTGEIRTSSETLHLFDLLRGLHHAGCKVALLCTWILNQAAGHDNPFPILTWHDLPGRLASLRREDAFQRIFKHPRPQVIHLWGSGLGRRARRLLHHLKLPAVFTPGFSLSDVGEAARIQRCCTNVIAHNQSMREALVNRVRVPREKVCVIAPGVSAANEDKISLQEQENPTAGNGRVPVVAMTAPLECSEGHDLFLDVARRILDSGRQVEFIIGGDGRDEKKVRRKIYQSDLTKRLTLTTQLAAYAPVIAAADVFVRPASFGCVGYEVLRAMSIGKPVVACATAGIVEVVMNDATGLLVMKNDGEATAAAIMRLLDAPELARKMGEAGRQRVAQHFNLAQLLDSLWKLYAGAAELPRERASKRW